jgi:hypothetical protein
VYVYVFVSFTHARTNACTHRVHTQVRYDEREEEGHDLEECDRCGRRFNVDRLSKHRSVCKGRSHTSNNTPKYDPAVAAAASKGGGNARQSGGNARQAKWQIQHDELQVSLRIVIAISIAFQPLL